MEEEKKPAEEAVLEMELEEKAAGGGGEECLEEAAEESAEEAAPAQAAESAEDAEAPLGRARDWLKANQDNLKYLDQAEARKLESLLESAENMDAEELSQAGALLQDLEKDLSDKFNKRFDEVKKGLVNLREEMFKIPGYANLPDELQEVALNTFTNCELRLSNTNSIDALAEIFDNFENKIYPDLAGKIYALENPNVFPLNLTEILDSMPRLDFGSEEELDSALARLREAAMEKLKKAGPKA